VPSGRAVSPTPLEVIEQITYLIFIKRLDDLYIARKNKATRTRQPIDNPIYRQDDEQHSW
jgi:type I restriction enzyme M protein